MESQLLSDRESNPTPDEVRRATAFLAQTQRATRTGSFWWKVSTGEIVWSEEGYRLLEYPVTVTPTIALIMDRVHPEDQPTVQDLFSSVARDGTNLDFKHRLLMPGGLVKHVRVAIQPAGSASGELECVVAMTDTTEQEKTVADLEAALARITESKNQVQAGLAHASQMTTLGELAASIAEEVNQPLTGVVLNASASLRWLAADSPKLNEARESIQRIIRDGNRASDVISRMRKLLKNSIEAGGEFEKASDHFV